VDEIRERERGGGERDRKRERESKCGILLKVIKFA